MPGISPTVPPLFVPKNKDSIRPLTMKDALTRREQVFVAEYSACLNIRRAAIDAGYCEKNAANAGWRLMQKPRVQAAIEKAVNDRVVLARVSMAPERTRTTNQQLTKDRVLQEICRIAFADPRDVITWTDGELKVNNSATLTADQASTIAEITGQGPDMKVKFRKKETALNQLARHFGLLTEKPSVPYDVSVLTDEEFETFYNLALKIGHPPEL
jgi:phage terminase small subunit